LLLRGEQNKQKKGDNRMDVRRNHKDAPSFLHRHAVTILLIILAVISILPITVIRRHRQTQKQIKELERKLDQRVHRKEIEKSIRTHIKCDVITPTILDACLRYVDQHYADYIQRMDELYREQTQRLAQCEERLRALESQHRYVPPTAEQPPQEEMFDPQEQEEMFSRFIEANIVMMRRSPMLSDNVSAADAIIDTPPQVTTRIEELSDSASVTGDIPLVEQRTTVASRHSSLPTNRKLVNDDDDEEDNITMLRHCSQ
jgi:hypothetical protein